MKTGIVFFILLLACSLAQAQEQICSAFGKRLGDTFDPTKSTEANALDDGMPLYSFSPENKFRTFSHYYVSITPKTHKICAIWALGTIENKHKCEKEQDLLMAILGEKYGEPDKNKPYNFRDSEIITQGDRAIITRCDGYRDVMITLQYIDRPLWEIAEKERIELERKKVDPSGL